MNHFVPTPVQSNPTRTHSLPTSHSIPLNASIEDPLNAKSKLSYQHQPFFPSSVLFNSLPASSSIAPEVNQDIDDSNQSKLSSEDIPSLYFSTHRDNTAFFWKTGRQNSLLIDSTTHAMITMTDLVVGNPFASQPDFFEDFTTKNTPLQEYKTTTPEDTKNNETQITEPFHHTTLLHAFTTTLYGSTILLSDSPSLNSLLSEICINPAVENYQHMKNITYNGLCYNDFLSPSLLAFAPSLQEEHLHGHYLQFSRIVAGATLEMVSSNILFPMKSTLFDSACFKMKLLWAGFDVPDTFTHNKMNTEECVGTLTENQTSNTKSVSIYGNHNHTGLTDYLNDLIDALGLREFENVELSAVLDVIERAQLPIDPFSSLTSEEMMKSSQKSYDNNRIVVDEVTCKPDNLPNHFHLGSTYYSSLQHLHLNTIPVHTLFSSQHILSSSSTTSVFPRCGHNIEHIKGTQTDNNDKKQRSTTKITTIGEFCIILSIFHQLLTKPVYIIIDSIVNHLNADLQFSLVQFLTQKYKTVSQLTINPLVLFLQAESLNDQTLCLIDNVWLIKGGYSIFYGPITTSNGSQIMDQRHQFEKKVNIKQKELNKQSPQPDDHHKKLKTDGDNKAPTLFPHLSSTLHTDSDMMLNKCLFQGDLSTFLYSCNYPISQHDIFWPQIVRFVHSPNTSWFFSETVTSALPLYTGMIPETHSHMYDDENDLLFKTTFGPLNPISSTTSNTALPSTSTQSTIFSMCTLLSQHYKESILYDHNMNLHSSNFPFTDHCDDHCDADDHYQDDTVIQYHKQKQVYSKANNHYQKDLKYWEKLNRSGYSSHKFDNSILDHGIQDNLTHRNVQLATVPIDYSSYTSFHSSQYRKNVFTLTSHLIFQHFSPFKAVFNWMTCGTMSSLSNNENKNFSTFYPSPTTTSLSFTIYIVFFLLALFTSFSYTNLSPTQAWPKSAMIFLSLVCITFLKLSLHYLTSMLSSSFYSVFLKSATFFPTLPHHSFHIALPSNHSTLPFTLLVSTILYSLITSGFQTVLIATPIYFISMFALNIQGYAHYLLQLFIYSLFIDISISTLSLVSSSYSTLTTSTALFSLPLYQLTTKTSFLLATTLYSLFLIMSSHFSPVNFSSYPFQIVLPSFWTQQALQWSEMYFNTHLSATFLNSKLSHLFRAQLFIQYSTPFWVIGSTIYILLCISLTYLTFYILLDQFQGLSREKRSLQNLCIPSPQFNSSFSAKTTTQQQQQQQQQHQQHQIHLQQGLLDFNFTSNKVPIYRIITRQPFHPPSYQNQSTDLFYSSNRNGLNHNDSEQFFNPISTSLADDLTHLKFRSNFSLPHENITREQSVVEAIPHGHITQEQSLQQPFLLPKMNCVDFNIIPYHLHLISIPSSYPLLASSDLLFNQIHDSLHLASIHTQFSPLSRYSPSHHVLTTRAQPQFCRHQSVDPAAGPSMLSTDDSNFSSPISSNISTSLSDTFESTRVYSPCHIKITPQVIDEFFSNKFFSNQTLFSIFTTLLKTAPICVTDDPQLIQQKTNGHSVGLEPGYKSKDYKSNKTNLQTDLLSDPDDNDIESWLYNSSRSFCLQLTKNEHHSFSQHYFSTLFTLLSTLSLDQYLTTTFQPILQTSFRFDLRNDDHLGWNFNHIPGQHKILIFLAYHIMVHFVSNFIIIQSNPHFRMLLYHQHDETIPSLISFSITNEALQTFIPNHHSLSALFQMLNTLLHTAYLPTYNKFISTQINTIQTSLHLTPHSFCDSIIIGLSHLSLSSDLLSHIDTISVINMHAMLQHKIPAHQQAAHQQAADSSVNASDINFEDDWSEDNVTTNHYEKKMNDVTHYRNKTPKPQNSTFIPTALSEPHQLHDFKYENHNHSTTTTTTATKPTKITPNLLTQPFLAFSRSISTDNIFFYHGFVNIRRVSNILTFLTSIAKLGSMDLLPNLNSHQPAPPPQIHWKSSHNALIGLSLYYDFRSSLQQKNLSPKWKTNKSPVFEPIIHPIINNLTSLTPNNYITFFKSSLHANLFSTIAPHFISFFIPISIGLLLVSTIACTIPTIVSTQLLSRSFIFFLTTHVIPVFIASTLNFAILNSCIHPTSSMKTISSTLFHCSVNLLTTTLPLSLPSLIAFIASSTHSESSYDSDINTNLLVLASFFLNLVTIVVFHLFASFSAIICIVFYNIACQVHTMTPRTSSSLQSTQLRQPLTPYLWYITSTFLLPMFGNGFLIQDSEQRSIPYLFPLFSLILSSTPHFLVTFLTFSTLFKQFPVFFLETHLQQSHSIVKLSNFATQKLFHSFAPSYIHCIIAALWVVFNVFIALPMIYRFESQLAYFKFICQGLYTRLLSCRSRVTSTDRLVKTSDTAPVSPKKIIPDSLNKMIPDSFFKNHFHPDSIPSTHTTLSMEIVE